MSQTQEVNLAPQLDSSIEKCFIHMLSFDVLHNIFSLLFSPKEEMGHQKTAIRISHVCQLWRQYALDIPTMWGTLEFRKGGNRLDWQMQMTFLERSGNAPLQILIVSGFERTTLLSAKRVARILRVLNPHIHRWRNLYVGLHVKGMRVIGDQLRYEYAPSLEALNIDVYRYHSHTSTWRLRMFNGGLPRLQYLSTHIPFLPTSISDLPNMDQLRELELADRGYWMRWDRRPEVEDILRLLSKCPNLESIKLGLANRLRSSPDPPSEIALPVSLPNLVKLDIGKSLHRILRTPFSYTLSIWEHIHAPRLRSIDSSTFLNSMIPIIATSNPFPGLETLTFNLCPLSPLGSTFSSYPSFQIQSAFANLSSLIDLAFNKQTLHDVIFQILGTHCPHLTDLTLEICQFEASDCIRMVEARGKSTAVSSIKHLRIYSLPERLSISIQDHQWFMANVPLFSYGTGAEDRIPWNAF
ncbi:hypothetical protein FRC03_012622 [Tulasnella sp. 419]|nr:hypothetical protein FRC03_012622 [Tulasnella sp. 419]